MTPIVSVILASVNVRDNLIEVINSIIMPSILMNI